MPRIPTRSIQSAGAAADGSHAAEVLRDPGALLARQVLTFGVDSGDALGGADIPDTDGFVPRRRDEEVRVAGVPTELIHTVPMAPVVVLLHLKREDSHG